MGQSEPAPPSSYAFIAQYAKKGFSMMGRTDADFNVNARVNADITPNLSTRVSAEITQDGERDYLEVDTEYRGSDWTGQVKYQSHGPIYAVSYAQGISKMFSAGLEAMFAPKMGKSFFAGQIRFTPTKRDVFTAQFSSFVLGEFSYVRAVTRHLKVASSLVFAKNEEGQVLSIWSAGYVYDFFGHMTVKGAVTQLSEVNVLVEEKLSDAISVSLSGRVNYPQNEYKFGLGASLTL